MKINTLSPVVQEEVTGCGIAAAANILGKSYPQMKEIAEAMGIKAADKRLWSRTDYVRRMLSEHGIQTSMTEETFRSWSELPDTALLAIKHHWEDGVEYWHWVVFHRDLDGEVVLDSAAGLSTNTRRDFVNMQPKWFIEVRGED